MVLRDELKPAMSTTSPVRWEVSTGLVGYPDALARMEREVEAIRHGEAAELIWLLEHPPLYTAGTSANPADLVAPDRFPVFDAGRGGQYTYHGPGQRVAYVMLDLRKRGNDVRAFVTALEEWIIRTLTAFGIAGERREDRVGVWVTRPGREDKIAALGIRVRHGISFHGISINLDPDLSHFEGIVPCGISEHGVTSFRDLGLSTSMADLDAVMAQQFAAVFQADIIVT
ncbi:lipoyl(octanoyl) transferase LipB [Aestuariivirga sp.]|uniref:lipoyl(octanoyl) transferase LipB n=1 Tax=Aestuariivirga sp. TaxID=2650926 RepID=UPI0039E3924C